MRLDLSTVQEIIYLEEPGNSFWVWYANKGEGEPYASGNPANKYSLVLVYKDGNTLALTPFYRFPFEEVEKATKAINAFIGNRSKEPKFDDENLWV